MRRREWVCGLKSLCQQCARRLPEVRTDNRSLHLGKTDLRVLEGKGIGDAIGCQAGCRELGYQGTLLEPCPGDTMPPSQDRNGLATWRNNKLDTYLGGHELYPNLGEQ